MSEKMNFVNNNHIYNISIKYFMLFTRIHEIIINNQTYYIHEEIMKYCHYFDAIIKGNFQEKQVNLDIDIGSLDFNIIINIFYRYYNCLEDSKGAIILYNFWQFDETLYESIKKSYRFFFAYHNCFFKDLITIINILDFLQPNIKINPRYKPEYNLNELIIDSYASQYKLNHVEIIDANIDIRYKKKLMQYCMGIPINDNDYPKYHYTLDIKELDGKFYCDNLEKYFEYYNVPLKYEFRDYHIEHRVEIDIGIDNMGCDEYEYDELEARLYINDKKICKVCKRSSISRNIIDYIINYLVK